MQREKYTEAIKNRIKRAEFGSVFILSDFSDIAETDAVRKAITRIENEGTLIRIIRGVYYKPEYNALLKENIAPSPDNVAHAIARNFGWTIVPSGDTALNILGLSTQVPSQWVYVSDGAYKDYTYDNTTITFKRTTNKEISKVSYKTALTIQSIKAYGKENITDEVLNKLKNSMTDEEKRQMFIEAKSVTAWVYEYIRTICKSAVEENL